MPIRRARWFILAEDRQHQNFIYHWLRCRGVLSGAVQRCPLPLGRGSGEQYVREALPHWLGELRRRRGEAVMLMVVTDADEWTVEARLKSLGPTTEEDHERVLILIPRRNIETWIAFLVGEVVDEERDYKPRAADACQRAAASLAVLTELPAGAPNSLRRGWEELRRVRVAG